MSQFFSIFAGSTLQLKSECLDGQVLLLVATRGDVLFLARETVPRHQPTFRFQLPGVGRDEEERFLFYRRACEYGRNQAPATPGRAASVI